MISYLSTDTEKIVRCWSTINDVDAEELILMHMEEKFSIQEVVIVKAVDHGDFLTVLLKCDSWDFPREFSILDDGSLAWDF